MSATKERVSAILALIRERFGIDEILRRQAPKPDKPLSPSIRPTKNISLTALNNYWSILEKHTAIAPDDKSVIADEASRAALPTFNKNIENFIGTLKIPVGIMGPLRINGIFAQDDFYIPLATTEATLVASYGRGAALMSAAGGCSTAILNDGLTRSPAFGFKTISEAGLFANWVNSRFDALKAVAEATTGHGRLTDIRTHVEGSNVYLNCEFMTGDAAGQNMTTLATQALCHAIVEQTPVKPAIWFLETNFSGDKKASAMSFLTVRGKKATAEVLLPRDLVEKYLHTSVDTMVTYWRMSALGGVMSGTLGVQGHYANGLAALYLATGQDAACVAESAVGVTRMEQRDGALYASVTLPNIIVGTVGGGTGLPTQSAGLRILGLKGGGNAHAFAEVCAAVCLAGELSLIGAISAGHFARAHQSLARTRSTPDTEQP